MALSFTFFMLFHFSLTSFSTIDSITFYNDLRQQLDFLYDREDN